MEPRWAEVSGSKIVRYVEADARSGDKRFNFLARSGSAQEIMAGQQTFNSNRVFPDHKKAPFGFESLSPSTPSSAILQAINKSIPAN
jgi:hypothetical protein